MAALPSQTKTKPKPIQTLHINTYLYLLLGMILLGIYVSSVFFLRYDVFLGACIMNNNPLCYSDWTCKTDATHDDNTLNATYSKIVGDKNLFITTPSSTPVIGNNVLSAPPSTACKDPALNETTGKYKTLNIPAGQVLNYGATPLSSYTGTLVSGLPSASLYCQPTETAPYLPSFFPNGTSATS
jgi:hypothetical protein